MWTFLSLTPSFYELSEQTGMERQQQAAVLASARETFSADCLSAGTHFPETQQKWSEERLSAEANVQTPASLFPFSSTAFFLLRSVWMCAARRPWVTFPKQNPSILSLSVLTADNIKCFSQVAETGLWPSLSIFRVKNLIRHACCRGAAAASPQLHHCCAEPSPAEGEQSSEKNPRPPWPGSAPSFFKNNISHYIHGYRGNLSRMVCEAFASQTWDKMWLNHIIWLLWSLKVSPETPFPPIMASGSFFFLSFL